MALLDVSKMITNRQRRCMFAEWFVRVYRNGLGEALTALFQPDLEEGQPLPDFLGLVDSLVRRLRQSFDSLTRTEKELLSELKEDTVSRSQRDELTTALREAFVDARALCRTVYGPVFANRVGFPRRIAEEPLALLRQTSFVVHQSNEPDLAPGDSRLPQLNATLQTILDIFLPHIAALEAAMESLVRETTTTQGKQVAKNQAMKEFDATFTLFVSLLEAAFRLAGKTELAERFRPRQAQRPGSSNEEPDTPPFEDDDPEAPLQPAEITALFESQEIEEAEEDEIR